MKKLKTLKNIEYPDHTIPRMLTPENEEEIYAPRILDEKYVMHVSCHEFRNVVMDWILALRQPEKERKRTLEISHKKWLKEYEQGMHQEDGYDEYAVMLHGLPNWHKEEKAQVKILKKIFNITEKDIKEHGQ